MAEVICIPATAVSAAQEENRKIRVAAYCRVSSLPQEESYESQVEHFTTYIQGHPDWILVKVYGDEGITGLNTAKRKGFRQMLRDGKDKRYDILLVKSISRLGRNTVDLLNAVRELKSAGVVCYFEKENINTGDNSGELMITLLSAFAQMESESISQNVRIGLHYKMQRGEWSVAYTNFLGYDKQGDGVVINLEGAATVRMIFDMFLSGYSLGQIVKRLIKEKRRTGAGTLGWTNGSVRRILQNRKYCGDVVLQLSVVSDLINKKRVKNTGQSPQYVVVDGIPAIVSRQTYYLAQGEMERRGRMRFDCDIKRYDNGFTGKLVCSCGANYNRANARGHYIWKCYKRVNGNCTGPIIREEELKAVVLSAVRKLYELKPEIVMDDIPKLSSKNTPEELCTAAEINIQNEFRSRVQKVLDLSKPKRFDTEYIHLINKIEVESGFVVKFYTGKNLRSRD
ncbi:MAG: recombinase family protein [Lachnospiraceae bacterium]|nr:recombinase family protein [Lachnospiraceae bacterium]